MIRLKCPHWQQLCHHQKAWWVSHLIIGDILSANAYLKSQGLNPVKEAAYNSYDAKDPYNDAPRQPCFPNTRVEVLNEIQRWMKDVESESIYVLFGVAGIGKSTIPNRWQKLQPTTSFLGRVSFSREIRRREAQRDGYSRLSHTIFPVAIQHLLRESVKHLK